MLVVAIRDQRSHAVDRNSAAFLYRPGSLDLEPPPIPVRFVTWKAWRLGDFVLQGPGLFLEGLIGKEEP